MRDLSAAAKRRILLVAPSSPFPADWGGAQRTALLLEALGTLGEVDLLVLEDALERRRWTRRARSRLLSVLAPAVAAARLDHDKAAAVDRALRAERYDLVVIRYSATACQLGDLGRRHPGVAVLVDVDDSLAQLFAGSGAAARWARARERRILAAAEGLWWAGPMPDWLAASGAPATAVLPNIPFHLPPSPPVTVAGGGPLLLGVAQYRYPPNGQGFDWFVRRVWPIIRHARPDSRLRLVGRPPRERVARRWRATPGVELAGRVDDVVPHYAAATVALAPIQSGGGTKIKILEALAMGVPCVCSPHAALGLETLDSLVVAPDAASFASQCLLLATDPPRRADVADRGRRAVAAHFSPDIFLRQVERLVKAVEEISS